MATNQILPTINRRDFIKFVFGTASAAAVSGALPLWPTTAIARPIAEPARLALDYDYLVDPDFDCFPVLPTYREFLSLEGLSGHKLKKTLEKESLKPFTIEAHKSKISVSSIYGKGTNFYFKLPISE